MLRLNEARFNGICCRRQEHPQRQQGSGAHVGQTVLFHLVAKTGVEHPPWDLQSGRPVHFALHAAQYHTASASRFNLNVHLLPVPGVPTVMHFAITNFMGVLYPTCTTRTGHIWPWRRERLPVVAKRRISKQDAESYDLCGFGVL